MKVCSKCHIEKPLSDYTNRSVNPDGLETRCRECKNAVKRAWYQTKKQHVKDYNKQTRYLYYDKVGRRLYRYKLSVKEFEELLIAQDYMCYLCKTPLDKTGRVCIDHDYITGKVRKILCIKCNTGLGMFNESANDLRRAADYLDYHRQGEE